MTIWFVRSENCEGIRDVECAWTNKEEAEKYLKEISEECDWHYVFNPIENDKYIFKYKDETFCFSIFPLFLDEKPFF